MTGWRGEVEAEEKERILSGKVALFCPPLKGQVLYLAKVPA
jgi:hypothetical protein